ncbi:MAG: HAD family hydrolase [Lachnospiraceae bacterium]
MKKIFCFDIDHTLLDYRSFTIPEEAIEAIKELKQQGHIIALASGRNLEHGDSNIYVDMVEPHAGIHCNGQKVTVGNKILFERRFNPCLLKDILEYSKQNNICIGIGVDVKNIIHSQTSYTKEKWKYLVIVIKLFRMSLG